MIYFTKKKAAQYCKDMGIPMSEKTLSKHILSGKGPLFHKFNNRVLYTQKDLDDWISKRISRAYKGSFEIENTSTKEEVNG